MRKNNEKKLKDSVKMKDEKILGIPGWQCRILESSLRERVENAKREWTHLHVTYNDTRTVRMGKGAGGKNTSAQEKLNQFKSAMNEHNLDPRGAAKEAKIDFVKWKVPKKNAPEGLKYLNLKLTHAMHALVVWCALNFHFRQSKRNCLTTLFNHREDHPRRAIISSVFENRQHNSDPYRGQWQSHTWGDIQKIWDLL